MQLKLGNWRTTPKARILEDAALPDGRRRAALAVTGMLSGL